MPTFAVTGMTCAHCEAAVARAVHQVDPAASVSIDLARGELIVGGDADPAAIEAAIAEEGYEATLTQP